MPTILGSGEHRYRVVENWAKLPEGWSLTDVASVAVDSKDRIYVFNRGAHPMVVLDRDGNFITSWGEGLFNRAHGLHIDADDNLYCTDDGDHTVRKCSVSGKVLLTIGIPNKPAPFMSGEPFHRCTHTALSPKGEIYVSDGYGNACVHKYTPDGKLMKTWGEPGTDPGQFNIVHNIVTDADGWVYVADRENHRVQVFDGNGKYETQWNHLHRPCALCACGGGKSPNFIVGELGPGMAVNRKVPNLGPRLSIVDSKGKRIARLGGENGPGIETGKFLAPHGIALDSKGDIYVGEVGVTDWKTSFPDTPMPPEVGVVRCLQKLERRSSERNSDAAQQAHRRRIRSGRILQRRQGAIILRDPVGVGVGVSHHRLLFVAHPGILLQQCEAGAARIAAGLRSVQGGENAGAVALVQFGLGGAGFLGREFTGLVLHHRGQRAVVEVGVIDLLSGRARAIERQLRPVIPGRVRLLVEHRARP